eukprot:TRINITY_DN8342_c0_g1_i5.p2 TRINITY_DN8342_c0_g1~~TRINITY_DN8342_c0_g1_i5.p2  ORF type:complete len:187 (+),score=0.94 TRINITY_DN8342_c0_g1_i5:238-798(+)
MAVTPSYMLGPCPVSLNYAQGTKRLKKSKVQYCNSTEAANSTANHPLKIRVRKVDRTTSLFGDTAKSYYGQVASQPKCKHIIMTARGNATPLDMIVSNKVANPCKVNSNAPLNKQTTSHNFITILPLSSQSRYQPSVHTQSPAGRHLPIHKVVLARIGGAVKTLSLIHICRCRRIERCRSRWSPYH